MLPHPLLELRESTGCGRSLEQRPMEILGGEAGSPTDHDVAVLLGPLQDRARAEAELLANLLGYGGLAPGRQS